MISYRFNDRDHRAVLAAMSEEERVKYLKQEIIFDRENYYETWSFWMLVLAGLVGLAIMISFVMCLLKMKKKNDAIISKVDLID